MNPPFEIIPQAGTTISYAAWQNSVPFITSIKVKNLSADPANGLELQLTTSSGFLKSKSWKIDRLLPGDDLEISDLVVELDAGYLAGLNEAEKSQLSFELTKGDQSLASADIDVRVLAREEWGGMNEGGELLAAFVMPNDPAVAKILKSTSKILERHGHSTALDGYQSKDPKRAYLLVTAIWNAVCGLKLTYANPPKSFERVGQKTRTPQTVTDQGLATCLDSTLLFAAAIEAVGLNPIIVMTQEHCFAGAWLIEKSLSQIVELELSELRKAIAGNELVVFETTLVTHTPPPQFANAVRAAKKATRESEEHQFVAAVDIARARMAQIVPLASHTQQPPQESSPEIDSEFMPLELPPELSQLPASVEEKPTTATGRIDRWQRKLLDLTLRNRLLNFRPTQQSIPILCENIAVLEDLLSASKRLRLISLPDQNPMGERDPELHRQKTNRDIDTEFARQALSRKEVACVLPTDQLHKRLTTIYRAVGNDMAEGGSNTLFLAVGFLRWRQKTGDKKTYRAPLLLIPVKLTRKSSQSPFYLRMHEDETRFNATLLQLLKQDFGKDLSSFESDLPTDENGVDVPLILSQVRSQIRDMTGFEVVNECALGRFSFAKYLLWRDLVDRTDQLKNNRVVRHLLDNPDKEFDSFGGAMPRPQDIDAQYHPNETFHPLDADSSQLAAVMAVHEGKDLVLIGPPGTGKSQTIANMIAQCLANSKTVLFVAEKTAALDVVYRRLNQHGLGDCCVELHSNKAERKKFLTQLEKNWKNNRRVKDNDWISVSDRLKVRRDELNDYVAAIHAIRPNGWSAFQAFGVSSLLANDNNPKFDWPETTQHDKAAYEKLSSTAKDLSVGFEAIADSQSLPFITATEWSMKWETELIAVTQALQSNAEKLEPAIANFTSSIGLPSLNDASVPQLDELKLLAQVLKESANEDLQLMFHKQFAHFPKALQDLNGAIKLASSARDSMSGNYNESLDNIPVDELDLQWREATSRFWPFSWFAKRKIRLLLKTYADPGPTDVDPNLDLKAIRQLRESQKLVDSNLLNGASKHWRGLKSDMPKITRQIELAKRLRSSIKQIGAASGATSSLSKAIHPFINGNSADCVLFRNASEFLSRLRSFYGAVNGFAKVAGSMPVNKQTIQACLETKTTAQEILENRTSLKRWTMWCGVKSKAKTLGLGTLISLIESRSFAPTDVEKRFEAGYADWFIPRLIDQTPILRKFETTSHENVIEEFKELDSQARKLASGQSRRGISHALPTPEAVPKKSELGTLRHQMQLKRPSKSIRDVVTSMPDSFRKLAPCLLMSPLSIAQYLPAVQAPFDVVIFDEASQIPTWDAIGAIARGRQTIIVGDPKQLPPTNFFGKSEDEEYDEETEDHEKDLESILDEALASGLPELQLNWHYRSRHESLIAFSNYKYYRNELITFPAAEDDGKGVSLVKVPDGVYDMGKSRTNRIEAEAIVDDAVKRMKADLKQPVEKRLTFGVITFNIQQQTLIQDLFDSAIGKSPEIEWYFSDARIEPTVVKNLENVQGDERDVMYFSITFGPTATNPRIGLNFGALNRDGGERRLNVAITRARRQMLVYSSFTADQLDATRSKSVGLNHLKQFLDFAESGGEKPLGGHTEDSVGGFDSPFEQSVAEALELRGWQVLSQIGVSGFRIDLGVRHPDKPGAYLAGVECDGATYHRSAAARDRDMTRQLVLEGLGWNILRIWSPDWWYAREEVVGRIDKQLTKLLETDRRESELNELETNPTDVLESNTLDDPDESILNETANERSISETEKQVTNESSLDPKTDSPSGGGDTNARTITRETYKPLELRDYSSFANRFYDDDYRDSIRFMSEQILSRQGPMREDLLANQIARAHGFKRTGGKIRDHVLAQIEDCPATDESSGRFLWSWDQQIEPSIPFRFSLKNNPDEKDQRSIAEISIAEICGLVQAKFDEMESAPDAVVFLAREIGIGRVAQSARGRIAEAIERARELKGN
ncbi:MAG: DUF3320 domain-containing protein [Mariniblastus sp.]